MYIACSSLCFANYSLEQAIKTIGELRFAKIDLALHEHGPHVRPGEVVADVNRVAHLLRVTNMAFSAFHLKLDHLDEETLRSVCRLGRLLTVPVLTIPAAELGSDLDAEVRRLQHLTRLAETEGMILTVETNSTTLTADPAGATELCKRVPGLGLTYDPSHYLVGPHRNDCHESLFRYVRHVRLRDSKPNQFQVRVGQGEIEYGKVINQLLRHRYERALTVDIHPIDADTPNEPEVRKLKFLLESMI